MSGKRKPAQNQPGTKITVEETAGKPPQDPPPPQKLKCFQDILDIVHSLSDEYVSSLLFSLILSYDYENMIHYLMNSSD